MFGTFPSPKPHHSPAIAAMAMASISVPLCVLLVLGVAAAALHALAQLEVELLDLAPSVASPATALLQLLAAMLWGWTLYCSYSH